MAPKLGILAGSGELPLRVIDACRAHGKVAGAGGMGTVPEVTKKILRMGVRFITAGNEWAFMMAAARQRAAMLRELPLE